MFDLLHTLYMLRMQFDDAMSAGLMELVGAFIVRAYELDLVVLVALQPTDILLGFLF